MKISKFLLLASLLFIGKAIYIVHQIIFNNTTSFNEDDLVLNFCIGSAIMILGFTFMENEELINRFLKKIKMKKLLILLIVLTTLASCSSSSKTKGCKSTYGLVGY